MKQRESCKCTEEKKKIVMVTEILHEFFTSDMTIELYRYRGFFEWNIFLNGAMEDQTRLVQRKGFNHT